MHHQINDLDTPIVLLCAFEIGTELLTWSWHITCKKRQKTSRQLFLTASPSSPPCAPPPLLPSPVRGYDTSWQKCYACQSLSPLVRWCPVIKVSQSGGFQGQGQLYMSIQHFVSSYWKVIPNVLFSPRSIEAYVLSTHIQKVQTERTKLGV